MMYYIVFQINTTLFRINFNLNYTVIIGTNLKLFKPNITVRHIKAGLV